MTSQNLGVINGGKIIVSEDSCEPMVVESLNFIDCAFLVSEHAPVAVRTETFAMELKTAFRLVLLVFHVFLRHLVVSMSKLALIVIGARTFLDPVLAHLCLELGLVSFLRFCSFEL